MGCGVGFPRCCQKTLGVIVPSFDSWRKVGGGFLPQLTRKVDIWLRAKFAATKRATRKQLVKVLSEPTAQELFDADQSANRTKPGG